MGQFPCGVPLPGVLGKSGGMHGIWSNSSPLARHLLSCAWLLQEVVLREPSIWKHFNAHSRLTLIAGPCVIENERLCLWVASSLKRTCARLGVHFVFKASFDKANRTSAKSFRGPGVEKGLEILAKVRSQ